MRVARIVRRSSLAAVTPQARFTPFDDHDADSRTAAQMDAVGRTRLS